MLLMLIVCMNFAAFLEQLNKVRIAHVGAPREYYNPQSNEVPGAYGVGKARGWPHRLTDSDADHFVEVARWLRSNDPDFYALFLQNREEMQFDLNDDLDFLAPSQIGNFDVVILHNIHPVPIGYRRIG